MTITRPSDFNILARNGATAFQREQDIGRNQELLAAVDNAQHLWAFLNREVLLAFSTLPDVVWVPGSSSTTVTEQPLTEDSTTAVTRFVVPYNLGTKRYGETNSALYWEADHTAGTIELQVWDTTLSTMYDSDNDTATVRALDLGSLDMSSAPQTGLIVVKLKATSGGTNHDVYSLWVQTEAVDLNDF